MSIERLTTERMLAEPIGERDRADLLTMHRNPRVMATLTVDGQPLPDAVTERRLAQCIAEWAEDGFGLWMFREQSSGRFVGRGGLRRTLATGREEVELAYAVMPEFWGQGYASEMARASVAVGFDDLGLDEIVSFTLTTNRASQRVMEKTGFQREREFDHVGLPHVLYRLNADAWRER